MRIPSAALVALGLATGTAHAEGPLGSASIYYVPKAHVEASVLSLGSDEDDGDGFGINARYRVIDNVAMTAEYHSIAYDDFGDLKQYRVGAGLVGEGGSGLFVEYISAEDAIEADGFGVHLKFQGANLYGSLGYLMLDEDTFEDLDGFEWTLGFAIPVAETLSAFADVRRTGLGHDDSDLEIDTADVRAGVRLGF